MPSTLSIEKQYALESLRLAAHIGLLQRSAEFHQKVDWFATDMVNKTHQNKPEWMSEEKWKQDLILSKKAFIRGFYGLVEKIDAKDYPRLMKALHIGNKFWRRFFHWYTGIDLGKTNTSAKEKLLTYTGYIEIPEVKVKPLPASLSKKVNAKSIDPRLGVVTRKELIEFVHRNGWKLPVVQYGKIKGEKGYYRIESERRREELRQQFPGIRFIEQYILERPDGTGNFVMTKDEYTYFHSL